MLDIALLTSNASQLRYLLKVITCLEKLIFILRIKLTKYLKTSSYLLHIRKRIESECTYIHFYKDKQKYNYR